MSPEIKQLIDSLNENALYRVSMSSIELFHSNFWDWMFTKYKESIQYFFEGVVEFQDVSRLSSRREHKNLDILIEDEQFFYIIENKIKSLPDTEQLKNYSNKKIGKKTFVKGIITSIVEMDIPNDEYDSYQWTNLDYKEIGVRIQTFVNHYKTQNLNYDRFDFELIEKYIKMISDISNLMYSEITDKNVYNLDTVLSEVGFEVVYKKLMGSMLKSKFLSNDLFKSFEPYLYDEKVKYTINHAKLTLTIYLRSHEEDTDFGIQIEDYDYRWFIVKNNKNKQIISSKKHKEEIATGLFEELRNKYPLWFRDEKFNRYVTEDYTFVYQKQTDIKKNTSYDILMSRVINDMQLLLNAGYLKDSQDN